MVCCVPRQGTFTPRAQAMRRTLDVFGTAHAEGALHMVCVQPDEKEGGGRQTDGQKDCCQDRQQREEAEMRRPSEPKIQRYQIRKENGREREGRISAAVQIKANYPHYNHLCTGT